MLGGQILAAAVSDSERYSEFAVSNLACHLKESCTQKVVRGMGVVSTGQDQSDLDQLSRQIGLVA
jgi:hypothetical protein